MTALPVHDVEPLLDESHPQDGRAPVPRPIRVGLSSDSAILREGLRALLAREPGRASLVDHDVTSRRTGRATDGEVLSRRATADLVLVDTNAEPVSLSVVLRRLHGLAAAGVGPLAAFGAPPTTSGWQRMIDAGASFFIPTSSTAEVLLEELEAAAAATGHGTPRHASATRTAIEPHGLTTREVEVLSLICSGRSNPEIAEDLSITINTVKTYVRSSYRKIGASSRTRAVLWGTQHGL